MSQTILNQVNQRPPLFIEVADLFQGEYKEAPISFDVDPLVLSVRLKKMSEEDPSHRYKRLENPSVKSALMGNDFNDAVKIKEYYSKKIMWSSLKDSNLSRYRADLMQYLQHPKTMLSKQEVGMLVTLPYFYDEDQIIDSITSQYLTSDIPHVRPNMKKITRELVFLHQTSRWVHRKKTIFYWFADDNSFVYNIQLEEGNVLRKFFEDAVLTKSTSVFETLITKVVYPFEYYKMFDYRLIK